MGRANGNPSFRATAKRWVSLPSPPPASKTGGPMSPPFWFVSLMCSEQRRHIHFRRDLLAVIFRIVNAIRQDHRLAVNLAIGDLRQQMRDAIEPRALLVDGLDDPPRRF